MQARLSSKNYCARRLAFGPGLDSDLIRRFFGITVASSVGIKKSDKETLANVFNHDSYLFVVSRNQVMSQGWKVLLLLLMGFARAGCC
jgi:hypothetical protein